MTSIAEIHDALRFVPYGYVLVRHNPSSVRGQIRNPTFAAGVSPQMSDFWGVRRGVSARNLAFYPPDLDLYDPCPRFSGPSSGQYSWHVLMEEFVNARDPGTDDDPPVTAVASRRVKLGREREFEEWVGGILSAAKEFPGYLGSEVLRPGSSEDDEYRIVFRFDHASNLHTWESSEERHRWLRKVEPLIHEEKVQTLTGLETWFTLPSKPGEPPPPRYKMAIVTWFAVFPLITLIFFLFGPLLSQLPTLLRTMVLTAVMVTLMTYVIMPRMTRLFSFWLYPDHD